MAGLYGCISRKSPRFSNGVFFGLERCMAESSSYTWRHKDLLDVSQLNFQDLTHLYELAEKFQEVNSRPVKKAPTLKGKTVMLFFAENSTRTKTSFDVAAKRLSADTFALGTAGSSMNKGESLKDTALTLQAMNPDIIVLRHSSSGAAQFLSKLLDCSVVNGGDGWHAHPTQALLDMYSLGHAWGGLESFRDKTLLILGDIAHSRVARSNIRLLKSLGAKLRICAPRTLLPAGVKDWPVEVYSSLEDAVLGVDAVMALRLQLERQQGGLLPDLAEYARRYCLTQAHLSKAGENVKVLHPGPMNRGLEISDGVADSKSCLVLDQVNAGVAMRMAILFSLAMRFQGEAECCL